MKKIIFFLLLAVFSFSGCEKDDICDAATPTTPRLVIEFYDFDNASELVNVTNLKVIGEGMKEGIVFNPNALEESKYVTSASKIMIPLKVDANTVTYQFILNYGNANAALIDTDQITFNYQTQQVYVSRACGYKTLFSLDANGVKNTAVPSTKPTWMQLISVEKNNIANENEVHLKIYI